MRRPARRPRGAAADEAVHAALTDAILKGRLPAGTRLPEQRLAAIFRVSRERMRKVLHRLAAERRIEIVENQGARVPRPTPEEIRSIYEAHRLLEAGILVDLAGRIDPATVDRLEAQLDEEEQAAHRGDRAASVRLSGAFHLGLADALGNAELSRFLRDLLSRSSVMVSLYEPAAQSICAVDEHRAILAALKAGDGPRAAALSREHFAHVEERLRLGRDEAPAPVLEAIFSGDAVSPRSAFD